MVGTGGADLIPEAINGLVKPMGYYPVTIVKNTIDIWEKSTPQLMEMITRNDFHSVVIYGAAAEICVKAAIDGFLEHTDLNVLVVADAIMHLPSCNLEELFFEWTSDGVHIVNTDMVIDTG